MASLRLCTHIKTNGVKCGSPALRHHTLCYFHYQWQRRDQRRVRLGGPAGMGKNTGIELPLLDGPEAILVSIMEIQAALLDQRIPIKMGTALLYSLQLALQARIPYSGLCGREPVRECPELELELDMERAKSLRPAKEKCTACAKQDTCLSPRNCKKLPKLPAGYHRNGDRLVHDTAYPSINTCHPERSMQASDPTSCHPERSASLSDPTSCHPERSAVVSRVVEGPFVSSPEAPTLDTPAEPKTSTASLRESSPGRESGVSDHKFPPSRAHARRQMSNDAPPSLATGNRQLATPYSDNILTSNPNPHIDLAGKFPQLAEPTQPEK